MAVPLTLAVLPPADEPSPTTTTTSGPAALDATDATPGEPCSPVGAEGATEDGAPVVCAAPTSDSDAVWQEADPEG